MLLTYCTKLLVLVLLVSVKAQTSIPSLAPTTIVAPSIISSDNTDGLRVSTQLPSLSSTAFDTTDLPYVEIIQFPTSLPTEDNIPATTSPRSSTPTIGPSSSKALSSPPTSSPSLLSASAPTDLPYVAIIEFPTSLPTEDRGYNEKSYAPTLLSTPETTDLPYVQIIPFPTSLPTEDRDNNLKSSTPTLPSITYTTDLPYVEVVPFPTSLPTEDRDDSVKSSAPTLLSTPENIAIIPFPTSLPTEDGIPASISSQSPTIISSSNVTLASPPTSSPSLVSTIDKTDLPYVEIIELPTSLPTEDRNPNLKSYAPTSRPSMLSTSKITDLPYVDIIQFPTSLPTPATETTGPPFVEILQLPVSSAPVMESSSSGQSSADRTYSPTTIIQTSPISSSNSTDAVIGSSTSPPTLSATSIITTSPTLSIIFPTKEPTSIITTSPTLSIIFPTKEPTTSAPTQVPLTLKPKNPSTVASTTEPTLPVFTNTPTPLKVPTPIPTKAFELAPTIPEPPEVSPTPRPTRQPIVFHVLYIYHMGHYHKKKSKENPIPHVGHNKIEAKYAEVETGMDRHTSPHIASVSEAAEWLKEHQENPVPHMSHEKEIDIARAFMSGDNPHVSSSHWYSESEAAERFKSQIPPDYYASKGSYRGRLHHQMKLNYRVRMKNGSRMTMWNLFVQIGLVGMIWVLL